MEIYFVTSNQNKLNEARQILQMNVQSINIDTPEIQAIATKDVVEQKVMEAYKQVQKPVFVEDTGLHIKAWYGLPGALIKWFIQPSKEVSKQVCIENICRMMKDFPEREAYAEACIGFYNGKEFKCFTGKVNGIIVDAPRGPMNFGWDPIFQPNGYNQTFAEMGPVEKNKISHRKLAFEEFKKYLDSLVKN
jgi:non-canonical purine NTP pyrophosphatase (RdgB/HAM1 family)